jgi:hypothetical protein
LNAEVRQHQSGGKKVLPSAEKRSCGSQWGKWNQGRNGREVRCGVRKRGAKGNPTIE